MNILKELRELRELMKDIPRNEYAQLDVTMRIPAIADRMDEIEKRLEKIIKHNEPTWMPPENFLLMLRGEDA